MSTINETLLGPACLIRADPEATCLSLTFLQFFCVLVEKDAGPVLQWLTSHGRCQGVFPQGSPLGQRDAAGSSLTSAVTTTSPRDTLSNH